MICKQKQNTNNREIKKEIYMAWIKKIITITLHVRTMIQSLKNNNIHPLDMSLSGHKNIKSSHSTSILGYAHRSEVTCSGNVITL